eukprot:scaffold54755_cov32-Tisochrysis_lutea.AAC.7
MPHRTVTEFDYYYWRSAQQKTWAHESCACPAAALPLRAGFGVQNDHHSRNLSVPSLRRLT